MTAGKFQPAQERSWRNGWGLLKFRYLSIILVLGLVAGLAYRMNSTPDVPGQAAERGGRRGGGAGGAGIPIPVSAFEVKNADVRIKLNKLLGTVTPLANVTIKTQINGRLISVDFAEGQQVKRGDVLAQIDPRPFQYALEQAEGQLARDKATLRNAELDLKRYRTLVAQDSIATQQLDGQEALVRQLTGTVAGDQAQVDTAKLNLSFCRIVAPIDGRTGLRLVDPGNYVQVGDNTGIVVITQTKPISVIFTIPEDELPAVAKRMAQGAVLAVTAFDRDQRRQLATGRVQVIDNQIDTTTGTVKLRAVFDNADETLFANQFVTVDLLVDTLKHVPVVSSAATQSGAPGTFVYVIKEDSAVTMRPVKLGQRDGELVQVLDGLQLGEKVVTDGLDRLKEGARVILREEKPSPPPGDATTTGDAQSDKPQGDKPKGERPRRDREGQRDAAPSRP